MKESVDPSCVVTASDDVESDARDVYPTVVDSADVVTSGVVVLTTEDVVNSSVVSGLVVVPEVVSLSEVVSAVVACNVVL